MCLTHGDTSDLKICALQAYFWCLSFLKVMLPAILAVQDTVQTTVGTVAHLEVPSHGHDHEHGFAVGHSHALDMEHMGVALFAAIGSIGAKEG